MWTILNLPRRPVVHNHQGLSLLLLLLLLLLMMLLCLLTKIEIARGQLRVNGRPITVAGANRHEHDDVGGKVVPLKSMVQDALVMKRFNFNAVRTSHYPNHPFFYEVRRSR